jgi:hypothetical protein
MIRKQEQWARGSVIVAEWEASRDVCFSGNWILSSSFSDVHHSALS